MTAVSLPGLSTFGIGHRIVVGADGTKGLFISLDSADLTKGQSVEQLAKVIASLQSVLAEREQEIAGLKERMAELMAPPQSPDDLSAALQSTVDSLQTELSRLSNPIANFAIKEFKIETHLGVTITPLGTVEYRFAGPGERVSPESQSQLSVTLVPVEKTVKCDEDLTRCLAPLRSIAEIADLAETRTAKGDSAQHYLEANHIYTIGDFVRIGRRPETRARMTAAVHVGQAVLAEWLDMAELLLIREVDYASIVQMRKAGIHGMRGLQSADAEKIVALLKRTDISIERVRLWQAIAERYLQAC